MIYLHTGQPGAGKTLYTIADVKARAERENRPVYYYGINDLKLPWLLLDQPEDWWKCPAGSLIVIDECQKVFRPRGNGAQVPEHVAKLEVHRHQGHDLYLITQHPMLADTNVRRLVGCHKHVVRKFGTKAATVHEFGEVREQCDKPAGRTGSIRHDFFYPTSVFALYHSAEIHTHKARIPMRFWFLIVLPVLLIALGYIAYTRMMKRATPKPETAAAQPAAANVPKADAPLVPVARQPEKPPRNYVADYKPRIEGMPQTAPIYDDLTKPVRAPYPAACVEMRGECKCFTEQATRLIVPVSICKEIVANGFYLDWQQDHARNGAAGADGKQAAAPKRLSTFEGL